MSQRLEEPVHRSGTPSEGPLVSVVTAVYNGERYLRESLESVLAQAGVSFELIVIDDGSSDATPTILEELAGTDPRVRWIRQENTGLTGALIRGCQMARGEFIARHDADDVSLPGRIAAQVALLRAHPSVALAACWSRALGPVGEVLYEVERPLTAAQPSPYVEHGRDGPPGHGTAMFRAADYRRVGGYRAEFYFAQDIDLWLRLCDHGTIAFVPRILYAFRMSEQCISTDHTPLQRRYGQLAYQCRDERRRGVGETERLKEAAALRPQRSGAGLRRRARHGSYFIGRCLLRQRDARAIAYFWDCIKANPGHWRSWLSLVAAGALCRRSTGPWRWWPKASVQASISSREARP